MLGTRRVSSALALVVLALVVLAAVYDGEARSPEEAAGALAQELPALALASPLSGFTQPVVITHAGDGSNRLFVVEQTGRVRVVKAGALLPAPFLDISTRISGGGERGLLGLAFPPNYAGKGYFYVNYTNPAGHTVISRFRRSAADPDLADPASEQIVITINQPFANHNGGQLAFSPSDGFLYVGMGDGGDGNDPGNRAQNTNELLGKILRLDVETGLPATYTVPATNPFVGRAGFRSEIWALGLRNPWRFSFDRATGDLFVADVGQGNLEEVNFQSVASSGGENYGWRVFEGTRCTGLGPAPCTAANYVMPATEYDHSQGCSVTGGYVYRGTAYARMQGLYIYGDFCSGRIWGLMREAGAWQNTLLLDTTLNISTFGEDEAGNLYVANHSGGTIYQLIDATPPPTPTPTPSPSPIPPTPTPTPTPTVQFGSANVEVVEGCTGATFTVTRGGSNAGAFIVDYVTVDGAARQATDFTYAAGRLSFAPGETSKTIVVSVNEDSYVEGDETATLTLNNPAGASLGAQNAATLTIKDDDSAAGAPNPIDDSEAFVCQHYHDFLNREPDAEGLAFWTGQITEGACGTNAACLNERRESVSAAFFLSIEFQETGYLVHRYTKASFNRLPRYFDFLRHTRRLGEGVTVGQGNWQGRLEANRQAFTAEWVASSEFRAVYDSKPNAEYVDALFANSEVVPAQAERDQLVSGLDGGTETRASVLYKVASNKAVYDRQYNSAFVLAEYFGYLRRNPDDPPNNNFDGYFFWLDKLNQFGDYKRAEMVKAFNVSLEYRARFGQP